MNQKLDCEIVRDLLPSYTDGLTNETTNNAIAEHLSDCPECSEALRLMKEPQETKSFEDSQVDYLKKVRRNTSRVGIICGIVMMLIGMMTIFSRIFLIGNLADAGDANFDISTNGNTVYVNGNLTSSGNGVARVVFEESAGIVNVKLYTAPKAFFNSAEINEEYTANNDTVGEVRCGNLILWENGVKISHTAAQLYEAINPFVGDMPSNAKIAEALGVYEQFGPYTNELSTAQEPYGWTLVLETEIPHDDERVAHEIMAADSYVMLATIDNLGYVSWEYDTDLGKREYTVTLEDADTYAGRDIKECSQSAGELQGLLESLSMKWSGVRQTTQESETFALRVCNNSDSDIYYMGINYYLDGKLLGSGGAANADGSSIKRGDEFTFTFSPEYFPDETSAIDLSSFSFDLTVESKDGAEVLVCEGMQVPAKYAWSYLYSLTGDFKTGFTLNADL